MWIRKVAFITLPVVGLAYMTAANRAMQVPASSQDAVVERFNHGVALMDQFRFNEAVTVFQSLSSSAPDLLAARINLGICYYYSRQKELAEQAFSAVLSQAPQTVRAHYMLGLIHLDRGETERALEELLAVRRIDPEDPSTSYLLGRVHMELRRYQEARGFFQEVVDREPYNASAHYNLATALRRNGDLEAATAALKEFQRLQGLFGTTAIGLQYLEQGRYAEAVDRLPTEYARGADQAAPAIPVRFVDVTEDAGLEFVHSGPGADLNLSAGELYATAASFIGSGPAAADFDNDGHLDLFFGDAGSEAQGALYRNRGDGTFEDITRSSGVVFSDQVMMPLWGDYDGDSLADLYLVNFGMNRLLKNLGGGRFEDVTEATQTGSTAWGLGGTFVDYDHDGDLDIFVVNFVDQSVAARGRFPADYPGTANQLYRNNGNGTFTDVSAASGLSEERLKATAVVSSDLDNSRDVDFYVANLAEPHQLFSNLRDGSFRSVLLDQPKIIGAGGIGLGDLTSDGFLEVAVASVTPEATRIYENRRYHRFGSSTEIGRPGYGVQFLDFDNDGDQDLLLVSGLDLSNLEGGVSGELSLFENREGRFQDVSAQVGLNRLGHRHYRGVQIADFDGDGDLDIAAIINGGRAVLLSNEGGNANAWLTVRLKGTNSNGSGIGAKVEVKAGRLWQKLERGSSSGFLSSQPSQLHFGLAGHEKVDAIRVMWPNGVLQSELDLPVRRSVELVEVNRKGTSCPILYVWNGQSYSFQTDFLGGSAYGYLLQPGTYNYPDTDEYIKLERDRVAVEDNRLAVALNNQLEEAILFDQLELVVVDHPPGVEVYPDEKLLPGPPYQDFKLFTVSDTRPVAGAWDGDGRNILPSIEEADRIYPELFTELPFKGYATEHSIVLDLGSAADDRLLLLMYAWIDYADSTSNLAASQAGLRLRPPVLQVQDGRGEWVTAIARMGFPAGLPKWMTVDLEDVFPSDSRMIRIVTNMRIHWDQILVAHKRPDAQYRLRRLVPKAAELTEEGFPEFSSPDGRAPKRYFYDRRSATPLWKLHVGAYTRLGNVLPLLLEKDDMYVITKSGDQVEARFDLSAVDPLPAGWVRDYLIYVDGYGKDMDPNSAAPSFLGPLPYHGMPAFPYRAGESYPMTPEHQDYLRTWNTRIVDDPLSTRP